MLRLVPFLLIAGVALADDGWLASNAVAFKTVEAGNGFEDLQFLKPLIGDARIVSLGEATHGTREFFQMKHRLLEFLATQLGFSIFSIEACMPEAYAVNDYVEHGRGDPVKLIPGMYFWTWRTDEVRTMVEWMRTFNAAGNGPLRFTGFDMQTPHVAARNVALFARDDLRLRNRYAKIVKANRSIPQEFGGSSGVLSADDFCGKTVRISGKIRTRASGPAAFWIRADKGRRSVAFDNMRATAPFGTVGWKDYHVEIDVPDDADTIFFGLILKGGGTAWFDGVRILVDGKELKSNNLDSDFEGAKLQGAPAELRKPIAMRSIGALVEEHQSYPHPVPDWFDLLVYIEESSAAVELKR